MYLYSFLYPYYIDPLKNCKTEDDLHATLQKPLANKEFKNLIKQVTKSGIFMHLQARDDIETEIEVTVDEEFQKKVQEGRSQQQIVQVGKEMLEQEHLFDYRKINYLETHKKNINFSFMQSLCLISAYLAGANKESLDSKIF